MKKIISLFERHGTPYLAVDNMLVDITGAQATVKLDGTCCMVKDGKLYARRAVKPGKKAPEGFIHVETRATEDGGKLLGWIPVTEDNPEQKQHRRVNVPVEDGTYELCGPKIQGNPYDYAGPELRRHGQTEIDAPSDFEGIRTYLETHWMEGIVWWRDGEPIAKIKRVDFGIPWPTKKED